MTREEAKGILEEIKINDDCLTQYTKGFDEAIEMAIKALEQEPCDDAISRESVKAEYRRRFIENLTDNARGIDLTRYVDIDCEKFNEFIDSIPSINPQPKIGHWIQTNEFFINQDGQFIYKFICSECKYLSYFRKSNKKAIGANVCPNCSCRMIEPQESEGKE